MYFMGVNTDMIRVKFVKDYKQYSKGDVQSLSPNEAFGIIDAGFGIVSKDMTEADYKMGSVPMVSSGWVQPKQVKTKEK